MRRRRSSRSPRSTTAPRPGARGEPAARHRGARLPARGAAPPPRRHASRASPATLADLARRSVPVRPGEAGRGRRRAGRAQLRGVPAHRGRRPGAAGPGAAATRRPAPRRGRGARGRGRRASRRGRCDAAREAVDAPTGSCSRSSRTTPAPTLCSTSSRAPSIRAGDPDAALATLERLVREHPRSAHYAEAQFRRGEAFFSAQRYADAERAYAAVLVGRRRSRDSPSRRSTSSRGRCSSRARDEESNARLPACCSTACSRRAGRPRPDAELSRAERELADDALRALAITFAAGDGPRRAAGGARPARARPVRVAAVRGARRPVRREGALPGRRRGVPRLRPPRAR